MPSVFPDKFPHSPASADARSASQSSLLGAATGRGGEATPASAPFIQVTHGPAGTSAEAGRNRQATRTGTGWVASILHRVSVALRGRDSGADGSGESLGRDAAIIGRRAERLHNHDPKGAAAYVERHLILSRGRV